MSTHLTQAPAAATGRALRRLVLILACALAAPLPAPAQAGCGSQPGGGMCPAPAPAGGASEPPIYAGAGNPINVISGNKYQREVDLPALPGELGLEIVRYYNSAYSGANAGNGLVGRGWRLSYETELHAIGNTIQVAQADGVRIVFNRDPRNPSLCSNADPANGTVSIEHKRDGDVYVWRVADGRKLYFNRDGKLVQIMAPSGAFVSLQYDPRGLLVKVTDPQWRSLHLSYPANASAGGGDRFRGVQAIDSPVGRFAYEYGGALPKGAAADAKVTLANLARVRLPAATDSGAKPGANATAGAAAATHARIYHYEDARFPSLLTGISLESATAAKATRYATYGYDSNGRANFSTHAGNVGKVTLDTSEGGTTVLTNSLGQKTVYRHAVIGGEHRLLEVRGPGCSTCGETNVRYRYDRLGRLTERTLLGADGSAISTTRTELDELGRAVKSFHIGYRNGRALAPVLVERNRYLKDGFQLAFTARPSVVPGRELTQRLTYNARGQVLNVTENGWSPTPGATGASAAAINRTTSYRYAFVNNRSVLQEIDGPLPNGKTNSPADSDIVRFGYDREGARIVKVTEPGNITTEFSAEDRALRPTRLRRSDGVRLLQVDAELAPNGQLVGLLEASWRLQANSILEGSMQTRSERYGYDLLGNTTAHRSAGHVLTRFMYAAGQYRSHMIASDNSQVVSGFDTEGRKTEEAVYAPGNDRNRLVSYRSNAERPGPIDPAAAFKPFLQASKTAAAAPYAAAIGGLLRDMPFDSLEHEWISASSSSRIRYRIGQTGSVAEYLVERVIRPDGTEVRRWFDDFLRIVAIRSTESGLRTAQYTEAGMLRELHDARGTSTHVVTDPAGRVQKVDSVAADGRTSTRNEYRYEGMVLVEATRWENGKPDNRSVLTADVWGQFTGKEIEIYRRNPSSPPIAMSVNNVNDADGRVVRKTLPSGTRLEYKYDDTGAIAAISLGEKTIIGNIRLRRNADGDKPLSFQYSNGLSTRTERHWGGNLLSHDSGAQKTWFDSDAAGNIIAAERRSSIAPSNNQMPAGVQQPKLVRTSMKTGSAPVSGKATAPAPVAQSPERTVYGYDQFGRLNSEMEGGKQLLEVRYTEGGDRLPVGTDGFDKTGNVIHHDKRTFAYGAGGQLADVRDERNVLLAEYRYDSEGIRVAKHTPHGAEYFLYEDDQLTAVADSRGRVISEYVYIGKRPIARLHHLPLGKTTPFEFLRQREPVVEYLHSDQRNAVEAVTDGSGAVLWRARLGAFGELLSVQGKADYMPLRLSGQYADAETGLYYNVHRYYDPAHGRYLQPDPLGIAAGLNTYAYLDGSPLLNTDHSGLDIDPDESFVQTDKYDWRPWLFGTMVHIRFTAQVRKKGTGWGGNDTRSATWPGTRPDAYFVDRVALKNEGKGQPFAGTLWELKPITWSQAVKPAKYKAGKTEVDFYIDGAQRGCWKAGSGSTVLEGVIPNLVPMGGTLYLVTYVPDPINDKSGLVFYEKTKAQEQPDPATAPSPALSEEERKELDAQMARVKETLVQQQPGWSDLAYKGFLILLGIAIAVLIAAIVVLAAEAIGVILTALAAALASGAGVMVALVAIFGLPAVASASELEKKGKEGDSGVLDGVINWFKKWL